MQNHMVYGCVKTFGRWDNFLTKDSAKEGIMLPQIQNPIFMFKMIHYNEFGTYKSTNCFPKKTICLHLLFNLIYYISRNNNNKKYDKCLLYSIILFNLVKADAIDCLLFLLGH